MLRRLVSSCFVASAAALAACSLPGSPGSGAPAIPRAARVLESSNEVESAKNKERLVIPFEASSTLATFDTAGKLLALISGSKTKLESPLATATDSSGNLYVVSSGGSATALLEFAKGADGNVAPVAADAGLTAYGIASDGSHVYVANQYTGRISEYAADPLGSKPIATLSGKKSQLCAAYGIAVASNGHLYVTQQGFDRTCKNELLEFAPLKRGAQDPAPIRSIVGSKTLIGSPQGVAVDRSGNVYVADIHSYFVLEFGSSQKGDAKPKATFGNGVISYYGVAVDGSGHLFAASPSATDYYGQIDVYDTGKPSEKPTHTLKVGKKPSQVNPWLISL